MDETLIKQVANLTGLAEATIQKQIAELALKQGKSPRGLSLPDLREIMVALVQELFVQGKEGELKGITINK